MTDETRRRRHWRRRPRRKPAGEAPPPGPDHAREGPPPEEGDMTVEAPRDESASPPAQGETGRTEEPEPGRTEEPEPATPQQGKEETENGVQAVMKHRRRRSRRRRGKGHLQQGEPAPGDQPPAETSATGEESGEISVAEPSMEAVQAAESEEIVEENQEALEILPGPPSPGEAGGAGPHEPAGGERKGRRRGRRRGRRKGKGAPSPGGEVSAAAPPANAEISGGAEGTSSEEPVGIGIPDIVDEEARVEEETEWAAEEDAEGTEAGQARGKGPRKVMLIDGLHPEEIRVAFVSDGNLDHFEIENHRRKAFKGNIYKGKVVNVAHAIEAAFVEFGGGRHGFLPLNEYCGGALMENLGTWNEGDKRPHLRPGMEILVQVTKEESSIKGAALTSYISIAGRYLVMMLGMKRYGISKKITGEKERERIRKTMEKLAYPEHLGFIVRTVGAGQPIKNLKSDMENLLKLWDRTVEGARSQKAPSLLYEEQDIVVRTLRDNYSPDVSEVMMNTEDSFRKASAFFDVYYPLQKNRLKVIRQKRPLFFKFNLEEQLERACARKVPLPSGGHIVIDRTEAIWSIDVNSGRSSKDRDIEDTAYRTNREAAAEAARQLRIRDMGGLIVIDFIDMENRQHIKEVEKILKDVLKRDKAKSDVSAMGKFGLVGISRQRMGISFYDVMLKGCDACGGTGAVSTPDAILVKLLRKIHAELSREPGKEVPARVSPSLLETLLNQKRDEITAMEKACGGRVVFSADPSLSNGAFRVGDGTG